MSIDVVTFGCRLNAYESEVIRREAGAAGLEDAVVVNRANVRDRVVEQPARRLRPRVGRWRSG